MTGLSATTAPVSTDVFYIVTDPGGTPTSNKVTGANMGKALTLVGKVTITQPASSATLTIADGLTLNAGPGGTLTALAFTTPGANVATFLATPSSANLAAAVTDETGTGVLVFATAPTFTTNITTPLIKSAGTLIFQTNGTTTALTLGTDQSATFINNIRSDSQQHSIGVRNASGSDTNLVAISWQTTSGGVLQLGNDGINQIRAGRDASGGFLKIIVNNTNTEIQSANGTIAQWIDSSGNTAIGPTTPGAKLDVTAGANQIALKSTGYSITGSGTTSMVDLAGTLNTSGVVDVVLSSITKTAAGAGSNHLNLKTGGTSVFAVRLDGSIDVSNIAAGSPNLIITKTSDSPVTTFNVVGTANASAAPSGFIEITEGGGSKYIPFYA